MHSTHKNENVVKKIKGTICLYINIYIHIGGLLGYIYIALLGQYKIFFV